MYGEETGEQSGDVAVQLKNLCELAPAGMEVAAGSANSDALKGINGGLDPQSFCELGKVASLIGYFGHAKRQLVRSIGFVGLLRMPCIKSLDEHFSLWLMRHLNPETMTFCLPSGEKLEVADVDAHFVLGIPFKGKPVIHDKNPEKEIVRVVLGHLGIEENPASLSLELLEEIITKDYGVKMTKEERTAFKVAFALYSMASFLAVQDDNSDFPIWLLRNFTEPSKIDEINWCGYVLTVLSYGVRAVQSQLSRGCNTIKLYGCTFLLQVFYLDNLCFGSSSPVLLDLPRGNTYKEDYIKYLIEMDRKKYPADCKEYGCHKLRTSAEVCYSRGWKGAANKQWRPYEDRYVTPSEIFHAAILYDEKLAALLAPALCSVSAITAFDIWQKYKSWYPDYTASFTPMPKGTFLGSTDCLSPTRKENKSACCGDSPLSALKMLAQTACKHPDNLNKRSSPRISEAGSSKRAKEHISGIQEYKHNIDLITEAGVVKKLVRKHSCFGKSPFELGCFMHTISLKRKSILFDWIENARESWGDLTRVWVHLDYPVPISLLGYNLKTELSLKGSFTTSLVDALSRSSMYLDDDSCGRLGTRWRRLCREEKYLDSGEIEAYFTGDHITYDVENCRMITAPVLYHGRWSYYFWDFQTRRITVLDPTRMKTDATTVCMHHEHLVDVLTKALFACIARFFSGWDFDARGWEEVYKTDCGPRSHISNSGLYSVIYSRYFDGDKLVCVPNQGRLLEPRSHLLYNLLTIKGNRGKLPPLIKDMVFKIVGTF